MIHVMGYRDLAPGGWGSVFFDDVLPAAVATHDGGVPYWPGSPYGESADGEDAVTAINGVLDGDRHAWEVWHGMDFGAGGGEFASVGESRLYRRYAADRGKFISEFGIHASPELATLRRWLPEDQLQVHSPGFDHHNKDNPKNKHDPLLEIVTGLPTTIEQYVDFTMISQAEGLKFGIEHYRRRQPHCSGTLIWQFNDVWPGFSWSVIDYAGVPKAGYHYARRAFAPVIASFCQGADGELQLWICNSSAAPVSCDAEVTIGPFSAAPDFAASRHGRGSTRASSTCLVHSAGWIFRGPGPLCLGQQPNRRVRPQPALLRRDQGRGIRSRACRVRGRPNQRGSCCGACLGDRIQLFRADSDAVAGRAILR